MVFFEVRGVRLSIKRISIFLSFNFSLLVVTVEGGERDDDGVLLACTPGSEDSSNRGPIPARNFGRYCHSYTSLGLCRSNKGESLGWASTESMRKIVLSRSGDGQGRSASMVGFVMGIGRGFVTDEGDSESRG